MDGPLLRSIQKKADLLKRNPFYGNSIVKQLIPKHYDVKNLWRTTLANYWRMLYTIGSEGEDTVVFIIDILDHKRYDKVFGYRRQ
ncbi:MAG: hypothetical protein ABIC95_02170 [archaeon]